MVTGNDICQARKNLGNSKSEQNISSNQPSRNHVDLVHILWTGGLDSTARIVELSRKKVTIQPYYVIDSGRKSVIYEKKAMQRIRERLEQDSQTLATILPIKEIYLTEVAPCQKITNAWKVLHNHYKLGSQYDFLARYAHQHGIILELGVEKGEGKAQNSIHSESKMISFTDAVGENFKISESDSTEEAKILYRQFTFPLWEKDKHAEVRMMEALGCGDIVTMTWFCHSPLFGKPCGHCNPCKDARHYGFSWRLSASRTILWYFLLPFISPKQTAKLILEKLFVG